VCVFRHTVNFKSCYNKCAYQQARKARGSPGQPLRARSRPGLFSVLLHKRCPESQDGGDVGTTIQPSFKEGPLHITG